MFRIVSTLLLVGLPLFSFALDRSEFPKISLKEFLKNNTPGEVSFFEAIKKRSKHKGTHIDVADHPGATIEGVFDGQVRDFRYLGCKKPIAGTFQPCFGKADFLNHYEQEVFISTDSEKVWIPIQKNLMIDFQKEIKKGQRVNLQLRYWGYLIGHKSTDDSLLLFAVGFDSFD